MGQTRILVPYFSFAGYSPLNVVKMTPTPLYCNGTFIIAALDRIKAGKESGHFAKSLTSLLINLPYFSQPVSNLIFVLKSQNLGIRQDSSFWVLSFGSEVGSAATAPDK